MTMPHSPRPSGGSTPRAKSLIVSMALRVQFLSALKALGWIARGKRVRGWNQLCLLASEHPDAYARWTKSAEPLRLAELSSGEKQSRPPLLSILILGSGGGPDPVIETRDSVVRAFGQEGVTIWTDVPGVPACRPLGNGVAGVKHAILDSSGEGACAHWWLPLKAGDKLSPWLGRVLHSAAIPEHASLVFWDDDRLIDGLRSSPRIKPDWDPILFEAYDGLTGSCLIAAQGAASVVRSVDPFLTAAQGASAIVTHLALREGGEPPFHIPLILTHRTGAQPFIAEEARRRLLPSPLPSDGSSLVSIIIPTRDQAGMLGTCLASLAQALATAKHEIIIVDNGSVEPDTLRFFAELEGDDRARIISYPGAFNFSALINAGVAAARGDFVCLLNNDVEATDGLWLEAMMAYAAKREVGAVGARLLYPDGAIQHAGVSVGIGGAAGHVDKGVRPIPGRGDPWHDLDRRVAAVTGACLLVEREKYLAAGGLDESLFAVDFNDVDLCLRLTERGWHSVYCAGATLVHHESRSRGRHRKGADLVRFEAELGALRRRWQTETRRDPHHSPLFRRASERCLLEF